MPSEKNTPLFSCLRACTPQEQDFIALLSETDLKNLYRVAAGKHEPLLGKAIRIYDAVLAVHVESKGRVPKVTLREIEATCRRYKVGARTKTS